MRATNKELGIEIEYDGQRVNTNHLFCVFMELRDEMYELDVKGKDVVDIGAFFGETAVYFSKKGAKNVYAYEPFGSYHYIDKNAEINNCENIKSFHEAVGKEDKEIQLDGELPNNGSTRLHYGIKKDHKLKMVSLKTITERHNIKDGVLKIDAEGSEFPIILWSDDEVLRKFKEIDVEVHASLGQQEALQKKLTNAGFDIDIIYNEVIRAEDRMSIPTYHCVRKEHGTNKVRPY